MTVLDTAPMTVTTTAAIRADRVTRVFGHGQRAVVALDQLSLTVEPGELTCLVGASGCGKTTLLHLLAGLDGPTSGTIDVGGRSAMLFQEAALLPWLTASAN